MKCLNWPSGKKRSLYPRDSTESMVPPPVNATSYDVPNLDTDLFDLLLPSE